MSPREMVRDYSSGGFSLDIIDCYGRQEDLASMGVDKGNVEGRVKLGSKSKLARILSRNRE